MEKGWQRIRKRAGTYHCFGRILTGFYYDSLMLSAISKDFLDNRGSVGSIFRNFGGSQRATAVLNIADASTTNSSGLEKDGEDERGPETSLVFRVKSRDRYLFIFGIDSNFPSPPA